MAGKTLESPYPTLRGYKARTVCVEGCLRLLLMAMAHGTRMAQTPGVCAVCQSPLSAAPMSDLRYLLAPAKTDNDYFGFSARVLMLVGDMLLVAVHQRDAYWQADRLRSGMSLIGGRTWDSPADALSEARKHQALKA
jgi:hypothetical protein